MDPIANRGTGQVIQTVAANYSTAPSGTPTQTQQDAAKALRVNASSGARGAWFAADAAGNVTLGASGTLWLCRHSIADNVWRKVAALGGGTSITLTATLGWEEPLDEVLADSDGFAVYDEGGGALGANVTFRMGTYE